MVMDDRKSYSVNSSSNNNVEDSNFRELEINGRNADSDLKRDSSVSDDIQDRSTESSHTAFPVNLKEVFELTSPSSEVNQPILRQNSNIGSPVINYQLSHLNSSLKCDQQKQVSWPDVLSKSPNRENDLRENSAVECDPFLVKPLSCDARLVPTADASWSHAFREPTNEQGKLNPQDVINLSVDEERALYRPVPHLTLSSKNRSEIHHNHRAWAESVHRISHKGENPIVNDVPFHSFALTRTTHTSLPIQENNRCNESEKKMPWNSVAERTIKHTNSIENEKNASLTQQPGKKDASCQVDDIPFSSPLDHHGQLNKENNHGTLSSLVQSDSQTVQAQVPTILSNGIKPELYTEERNLRVELGAKAYERPPQSGIHACEQCGKAFGDNRSLQRHLMVHSGLRSYHCHICNKAFMLKGDLTRHVRIHSGEKPYGCEICGRRFTLKGNLMQHFRTHSPEKQYACTICSKNYAQKDSLHRHIRAHFGDKPFQCDHCGKRFTLKGDLSRHVLIHSGVKPHICKFCGRNFSLKGNLTQHIRIHGKSKIDFSSTSVKNHNEQRLIHDLTYSHLQKKQLFPNSLTPLFKLPLEMNGSVPENLSAPTENGNHLVDPFNSSSNNVNNHQLQSTGLAFCSACSRTFSTPESLQEHVQLVHEQSTRLATNRYLCNVCKKEFSLKGDLTRHLNSHNGIKPYHCDQCEKTFTLKSNLRQHLTTHTLDKNFACPLCNKLFGNRRNLSLHLKRHEQASANFTCTKCGRSFLAKSDHFFHNCTKDSSETSDQVPLNCSLNGTTACSPSSSSSSPPNITTSSYTVASETNVDVSQSSDNEPDVYMVKKELSLQLSCHDRETNNTNPENLSQNSHGTETFFNPFYRHLCFATSNQTAMPNLRGLLHPPPEINPDIIKSAKAN